MIDIKKKEEEANKPQQSPAESKTKIHRPDIRRSPKK